MNYVKDYLWGYTPYNTDCEGYSVTAEDDTYNCADDDERFFGMWIPGNGLNHSPTPNTVYRTRSGGTNQGIDLVALRNIEAGEELYDDYRRHGKAQTWLLEWAKTKQVTLNFADCNDFVDVDDKN